MKLQTKIAAVLGALALATAPAMALASQPTNPGQGHGQSNGPKYTPGTPGTGRDPGRKGQGLWRLLPEPEQEARRRPEGHAVQPVRDRDGEDRSTTKR